MTDPGYWWVRLKRRRQPAEGPAPYHAVTLHQSPMRPAEGSLVRFECNRTGEVSESLVLAYPKMPPDDVPVCQCCRIALNGLNAAEFGRFP